MEEMKTGESTDKSTDKRISKGWRSWELCATFMGVGLFTFGGGYAMISVIEDICVHRKKWISHEEMMDMTVIAESTPGPIAINCATFVGYRQAGLLGAVMATLGVVLPSFAVIYLISVFLDNFLEIQVIAHAFKGIKAAVGILIVNAAVNMLKKLPPAPLPKGIALCSFGVMFLADLLSMDLSSIVLMLAAVAVSLAFAVGKECGRQGGAELKGTGQSDAVQKSTEQSGTEQKGVEQSDAMQKGAGQKGGDLR